MTPLVHWHRDLFLHPQHLQGMARHYADQHARGLDSVAPYPWGFRQLETEFDSVRGLFRVNRMSARFPDGTQLELPGDGVLNPIDVPKELNHEDAGAVFVAVPLYRPERANVGSEGSSARYRVELLTDVPDDGTGDSPIDLPVLRLNAALFTGTKVPDGYAVLKVARFELRSGGGIQPDPQFMPALLQCGVCPALLERVEALRTAVSRQYAELRKHYDDREAAPLTVILHEAFTMLSARAAMPELPPHMLYSELVRLLGRWAGLVPWADLVSPPPYRHDDLGSTFHDLFEKLERRLPDLYGLTTAKTEAAGGISFQ